MKISEISVELVDVMGSDLNVVNAARVSFDKQSEWEHQTKVWTSYDQDMTYAFSGGKLDYSKVGKTVKFGPPQLSDKDQKLINYLATHGHWSPFAHAFMSIRVKAPIFLARQLVKHQVGLSWNEVSRRYVDSEPEFWFPKEWRGRPVNAKQGSSDAVIEPDKAFDPRNSVAVALMSYNKMIADGIAPEQARMVLPQNTMTEWIWSGSLMAFARIYNQRSDSHAQKEAQEFAEKLVSVIPNGFEHSWKALTK